MKPGRLRPAAEVDLLAMASWYDERGGRLDVVRLLGERQDIAAILAGALD